ncbi:hypothetical protein ACFXK0_17065 [Nocardia sp. NPDC059177]|uniref:hypothetical protein n=1 Tax=Nocardia sp. NPDC059177 TaxID=3346759 RepID=UPI0036C144B6
MKVRTRAGAAVLALAVLAGLGATSCSKTTRWCERDQGDVLVANSYCENGVAGYEWEPDHDKPKYKKKPKKKR